MSTKEIRVVIHLGASAVSTVIAEVHSSQDIRILGLSSVACHDFYQGVIRHRERLKSSIKTSIQTAEDMSNCRVIEAWLSFASPSLVSHNSIGEVHILDNVIQAKDIVSALSQAKSSYLKDDLYLMHHFQQGIALDNNSQMVKEVIGLSAKKMQVMYHLMMMPVVEQQNLQQLLQECNVNIKQTIFDAVSMAEYALTAEEKFHGVCLIDIGAGTTSVCVYKSDILVFTRCFAEGGHDATLDISSELNIAVVDAEFVKINYASVDRDNIDAGSFFTINLTNNHEEMTINMQQLLNITEARYKSILHNVYASLKQEGLLEFLEQGFVIAGGGSNINGLVSLTRNIVQNRVRMVQLHPAISSAVVLGNDDERLRLISERIRLREYQTAFGTLLFSESEAFKYSEKSSQQSLQKELWIQSLFKKFIKTIKRDWV